MMKQKYFSKYKKPLVAMPNLVEIQTDSFRWLVTDGLKELFEEFSPIKDYSKKKFDLEFTNFQLDEPKYDEYYAKDNKLSYDAALRVRVKLTNKNLNAEKEQEIFLADFPLMTSHGTFIINGIERVIVPQLARSFGVFFTANEIRGRKMFGAKIIPSKGAWIEIESEVDNAIYVRIDRKRKFPISSMLRIFADQEGKSLTEADIEKAFAKVPSEIDYLKNSLEKDHAKTTEDSYLEIGSGRFIPGFEDQMIGMKAGEERVIEVTFPADYQQADLQNEKVKFEIKLLEIKEKILPELTDELVEDLGYESAAEFTRKNHDFIL
ncbi:MAG: FKBP-type peptidyl-prolyl cis-trans isomerase, partial [Patescibacteria group bacterium]